MLRFGFGLHGGIDEVVTTMAHWNNDVSPVSPFLVNTSGVGDEPVRLGAVRSVCNGSWQLVCLSWEVILWSLVIHLRSLRSFGSTIRSGFSNPLN